MFKSLVCFCLNCKKHIFKTPANEVVAGQQSCGGYTGFTRLSVCLCVSVCLSVCLLKSGFRTITPFPFDIQHMYCPCPKEDLNWFMSQKVKGQGQILTSNFDPFPNDNSISFLHIMMILGCLSVRLSVEKWFPHHNSNSIWHTTHDHDTRRTSIAFWVNRSKVKVKCEL